MSDGVVVKHLPMSRFDTMSGGAFLPTNRDKSPVCGLLGEVGYVPHRFFRATQGETGRVRFFGVQIFLPKVNDFDFMNSRQL